MAREDLIRDAKILYPVGSKFIDLVHGEEFTVRSHVFDSFGDSNQLYIPVEKHPTRANKTARIYRYGKWARVVELEKGEIISISKMEQVQEECKNRFPIGCTYKFTQFGTESIRVLEKDRTTYSIYDNSILAHRGGGVLYQEGKYAEVVGDTKSPMEIIQEECKKRFPIGCDFIPVGRINKKRLQQDNVTYSIIDDVIIAHKDAGQLYCDGKYAEVVSTPKPTSKPQMEHVQDECKSRFPIGSKYISADGGCSVSTLKEDDSTYSIVGYSIYAHTYGGYLYINGKYAKSVTPEDERIINMVDSSGSLSSVSGITTGLPTGTYKVDSLMQRPRPWETKSPIAISIKPMEEVSFRRIGTSSNEVLRLDKLVEEVSFKRISK